MGIGLRMHEALAMGNVGATPQQFQQDIAVLELDETDLASAATFTTDGVDLGEGGILTATLTTANITGSLTTVCQTSPDNSTWAAAFTPDAASYATAITGTFGAVSSNTATRKRFIVDRFVRFVHTIVTGPVDISIAATIRKN